MTIHDLVFRLVLAMLLGAAIGAERQWRQRMAGLRTNTLVCLGSALFVSLSLFTPDEVSPTRVAAQVVSGIGFLGAGVIFKEGASVRGLNTAATLWCSAAVGVLVGAGHLPAAAIGAGCVLVTNMVLRPVARAINRQPREDIETEIRYKIELTCKAEDEEAHRSELLHAIDSASLTLQGLWSEDIEDNRRARVRAELLTMGRQDHAMERVVRRMGMLPGVSAISWQADQVD